MQLFEAVEKVKNALSSKDTIAALTHLHLKEGEVFATNGAMTASAPCDENLEHVVPAEELFKAMTILGRDAQYEWSPELLAVKKGRRKITIRLLQPDQVPFIDPVPSNATVQPDFIDRVKKVRPFLSDDASRPWALTAWLHVVNDRLVWTATNNIAVVEVDADSGECPLLHGIDVQIPNFALDFIIARGQGLSKLGIAENRVTFYFEDGSKMTTQLFTQKMPEQVSKIVGDSYNDMPGAFRLSPEWRESYASLIELGPEEVVLSATTMSAGRRQATMEVEVSTDAPLDEAKEASVWNPKYLTPVVECAEAIDFAAYPAPARFQGQGIRGIIAAKLV